MEQEINPKKEEKRTGEILTDPGLLFPISNWITAELSTLLWPVIITTFNLFHVSALTGFKLLPEEHSIKTFFRKTGAEITACAKNTQAPPLAHFCSKTLCSIGPIMGSPIGATGVYVYTASLIMTWEAAFHGVEQALFPAIAGFAFGIGDLRAFTQTRKRIQEDPNESLFKKITSHPVFYYSFGYLGVATTNGGGWSFLASLPSTVMGAIHDPSSLVSVRSAALVLTGVGLVEIGGFCAYTIFGKPVNPATPFMGVALGSLCFAGAAAAFGNYLGVANSVTAFCGEFRLAIHMQQEFNAQQAARKAPGEITTKESRFERILTSPARWVIDAGLFAPLPACQPA